MKVASIGFALVMGALASLAGDYPRMVDRRYRVRDDDLNPTQAAQAAGDKTRGIKSKGRQGARARSHLMMRALGQPLA